MAENLTDTWNQHAFPDDAPGREERWSLDSERRRVADRTDFNLEQSGSTNKIRRFTNGQNDDLNGKTAKEKADDDMMMLLAVGSPAYMEAYDNRLTFQIGGEDIEITQGELHDLARRRAEDLQRQIDDARRRGASAEEIERIQGTLDQVLIVRDNTDPALGVMDEDRHRRVQDALNHPDSDPVLRDQMAADAAIEEKPDHSKTQEADKSARMDYDADTESALMQWSASDQRGSVGSRIDSEAGIASAIPLTAEFIKAATEESPTPSIGDDQPAPKTLTNNSGFSLG